MPSLFFIYIILLIHYFYNGFFLIFVKKRGYLEFVVLFFLITIKLRSLLLIGNLNFSTFTILLFNIFKALTLLIISPFIFPFIAIRQPLIFNKGMHNSIIIGNCDNALTIIISKNPLFFLA